MIATYLIEYATRKAEEYAKLARGYCQTDEELQGYLHIGTLWRYLALNAEAIVKQALTNQVLVPYDESVKNYVKDQLYVIKEEFPYQELGEKLLPLIMLLDGAQINDL